MSEYGKGYIAKGALLDAVQWDNDIEKWVIWDDDLQSLMTEKNDVVEVVRCKDCRHKQVDEIIFALSANPETALFCKRMGGIISETFYCAAGERMDGDKS